MPPDRRDFLKAAAAGCGASAATGIGVCGGRPVVAAESRPQPKNVSEPHFVRLAIATICVDGFGDENFEPFFALAPRLPFKRVEFNCWYARNRTPAGLRRISDRCEQHSLSPICIQATAGSYTSI